MEIGIGEIIALALFVLVVVLAVIDILIALHIIPFNYSTHMNSTGGIIIIPNENAPGGILVIPTS